MWDGSKCSELLSLLYFPGFWDEMKLGTDGKSGTSLFRGGDQPHCGVIMKPNPRWIWGGGSDYWSV